VSSTHLWIILPAAVGILLLVFRMSPRATFLIAIGASVFLVWAAWQLPIDVVLTLGPVSLEIAPSLVLFGRNFTLDSFDKPLLTFIYVMQTLWLFGTVIVRPNRLFIPLSFIMVSLFVAALAVDPFLYAALIIGMVILISVPLFAPPGKVPTAGVMRFLTFQALAVPFVLFTGWLLTGVEASPGNVNLALRSGVLLALGFTFILGLFPLHSWIPMLAEDAHPYVFGFLISFLPSIATLFGLSFLDRYVWLRDNAFVYELLLVAGSLAVLLAGLWAAGQRHLGRIFAYGAMVVIGTNLQAIGLAGGESVQAFFALLLPNTLALWSWAVVLGTFWSLTKGQHDLDEVKSIFRSHPFFFSVMVLSIFAIAGLPLLSSFPAHLAVWSGLAQFSSWAAIASLTGSLGLLAAGARLLFAFFTQRGAQATKNFGDEVATSKIEILDIKNPINWAFLGIAVVSFVGFGLLSRFFLGAVPALAAMYPQLFP
jgi:NADH-quinone oxidoreductase subunit N